MGGNSLEYVAVCGPAQADDRLLNLAEETGLKLGRGGAIVVTGGLGGVMAAASRGAKKAGGKTLGILPGETRSDANPFIDIAVPTGMGEMRNALVARVADGLIAIGGQMGTLSEIALALKMGKPVVSLDSWGPTLEGKARGITVASSPEEAVRFLVQKLLGKT